MSPYKPVMDVTLLAALLLFAAPAVAQGPTLGQPISQADHVTWDLTIKPDSRGLAPSSDTSAQGEVLLAADCDICQEDHGEGGIAEAVVAENPPSLSGSGLTKSIGNSWPASTTLFDFIGGAIHYNSPIGDYLVSALVTLLVVVDPVGLAPTFLAVTEGLPPSARLQTAARACVIAAAVLAGTALIGDWLLRELAITLPAFRIAGGLMLFAVASEMTFGVRIQRQSKLAEEAIEEHVRHVAAFPLAIPLMAGPGAITATLLLAGQTRGNPLLLAGLLAMSMIVIAACLGAFLIAGRIERLLGITGNIVLSRLQGVLLAALAVQFVIDGVRMVLRQ